jgi:hypothetical protein
MKKFIFPLVLITAAAGIGGYLFTHLPDDKGQAQSASAYTEQMQGEDVELDINEAAYQVDEQMLTNVSNDVAIAVSNVFSVNASGDDETKDEFMARLGKVMSGEAVKGAESYINAWSNAAYNSQMLCAGAFTPDDGGLSYENGNTCFTGTLELKVGAVSSPIDAGFLGQEISQPGTYTFKVKACFDGNGLISDIIPE